MKRDVYSWQKRHTSVKRDPCLWKEIYVCKKRRIPITKETCICKKRPIPVKRDLHLWKEPYICEYGRLCMTTETYICQRDGYLWKKMTLIFFVSMRETHHSPSLSFLFFLATWMALSHNINIFKKKTADVRVNHDKRDVNLWKETYICEKRPKSVK